jgi:hypothetical protein
VPENVPAATSERTASVREGAHPMITVEESVNNQRARLAEMAQKVDGRKQIQFSAHSHRIKFRFADADGNVQTDWSRDYRAGEIAEKSDSEVLGMLERFQALNSGRRVA